MTGGEIGELLKAYARKVVTVRNLAFCAVGIAVGGGIGYGAGSYLERAEMAEFDRQFRAQRALLDLYDLEGSHRAAHGTYAKDLDSLLRVAPNGEALRAELVASVDMNTLVVARAGSGFKIEANILDQKRTAVRMRGPQKTQARTP